MLGMMGKGVVGQKVKSGTLLALILIQRVIYHLIARIYVQPDLLAVHESMQSGEEKHPDLTVMKRFFPFPHILKANL